MNFIKGLLKGVNGGEEVCKYWLNWIQILSHQKFHNIGLLLSVYTVFMECSFQTLKSSLVFHAVQFVNSLLLRQTQHLGCKMGVHRACFTTKEYTVPEEEDKVQLEHVGCTSTLDCRGVEGWPAKVILKASKSEPGEVDTENGKSIPSQTALSQAQG